MLCERRRAAARPFIKEYVIIEVAGKPIPQRALHAEVDDPRQRSKRHAAEISPNGTAERPAPAAPQIEYRQQHRPDKVKAQHRVFEPECAPRQKAVQHDTAQRHGAGCPQGGYGTKKRRRQQRQKQLLRTAAVGKGAAGGNGRSGQCRPCRVQRPAANHLGTAEPQPEKGRKGRCFEQQHAAKAGIVHTGGQPVEKIQHRAFVVKHIPVQHPSAEHRLAHRKKNVCVHPVVEGIQGRGFAAPHQHQRRDTQQPYCALRFLFQHHSPSPITNHAPAVRPGRGMEKFNSVYTKPRKISRSPSSWQSTRCSRPDGPRGAGREPCRSCRSWRRRRRTSGAHRG